MDELDVEAHMEPAVPPQAGEIGSAPDPAEDDAALHDSTAGGRRGAAEAGRTPLGAESLAPPVVPAPTDPADASLLALVDRLSALLDRTDLTELEVQVGETGLILRKPEAIAPAVVAAAPAPAAVAAGASAAAQGPTDGVSSRRSCARELHAESRIGDCSRTTKRTSLPNLAVWISWLESRSSAGGDSISHHSMVSAKSSTWMRQGTR